MIVVKGHGQKTNVADVLGDGQLRSFKPRIVQPRKAIDWIDEMEVESTPCRPDGSRGNPSAELLAAIRSSAFGGGGGGGERREFGLVISCIHVGTSSETRLDHLPRIGIVNTTIAGFQRLVRRVGYRLPLLNPYTTVFCKL